MIANNEFDCDDEELIDDDNLNVNDELDDFNSFDQLEQNINCIAPYIDPRNKQGDPWSFRSIHAPNESEKEFNYFSSFLELGSGRSIQYLSNILNLQITTINKVSVKNNWKLRSSEYDRHILARRLQDSKDAKHTEHMLKLEQYRQEQEYLGKQLSTNAAKIAMIANNTLNNMIDNSNGIDIRDLPSMLNVAAKLADVGKQLQSTALGVDQLMLALEESDID
jgi:hypothetical protein